METERLIIRKPLISDAKELHYICNQKFVLKYNCFPSRNLDETIEALEKSFSDDLNEKETFHIIEKTSSSLIGTIGFSKDYLRYKTNSCSISYLLDENFARQGYMKEALHEFLNYLFYEKGFDIVSARAFSENTASIKLLEASAFLKEGALRKAVKGHNDIIHDDFIFSLLKEEYIL